MTKILITGGAGFIGSNFVRYMLRRYDYDLVVLDKLTYAGRLENLQDVISKIKFIKGDICKKEDVRKAIAEHVDLIINFAAESHVDRSIKTPGRFIQTDVYGTHILLEAARKFDAEFIQISTDEVYGSIEKGSFKETDILNPSSPYSASKASADLIAQSYYVTYGLPIKITRSTNNFGPYQYPEKLIPLFIINALRNKPLPLYGDGLNVRDWLYVKDNCEAIDFINKKGKNGEIYNIASGNERTNIEITKIILRELNKPESLIRHVKDRPGHDRRYSLDTTKIRESGWKPKHSFEGGMHKTVQWYVNNKWWWKTLTGDLL